MHFDGYEANRLLHQTLNDCEEAFYAGRRSMAPSITSERIAEIAKEQFDCVKRVACVADIETAMRKALREAGVIVK